MKKQKSLLDRVSVEKPCTADWDKMFGNDEVRFCEHCAKRVHNLSAMTRKDAERLVKKSNGNLCIRYYTDKNKKIALRDAPVQITRLGRRVSQLAASVFTAALSVSAVAAQGSARIAPDTPTEKTQTGEVKNKQPSGSLGTISGTVFDPQGAVIPNATITLFDKAGNTISTTVSNEEGFYKFETLLDDIYNIEFSSNFGFKKLRIEDLQISAGKETKADANMEVSGETATTGVIAVASPVTEWVYHSEKRAKINVEASEETLDFFNSVMSEDFDEVKIALQNGTFVDVEMPEGATPLMYAGSPKMAKFLLKRGANLRAQTVYGETALMRSAGNPEMVKFFLSRGLKANAMSSFGVTPLMYSMQFNEIESVRLLLNAGADPNISDVEGRTALMLGVYEGRAEIIKLLVESGADVNARDAKGKTVLMYAIEGYSDDEEENIRFLIEKGADVFARDAEGKSVLQLALEEDNEETIKLLKSYGATE